MVGMGRAEAFFKNILAVLLGLTLALMALEILLRVVQPVEYRVRGNKIALPRDKSYVIDNDKIDRLDRVIYFTRNRLGFRGEPPPKNFAQTLTILTVGGSTTECFHVSDGKTWPDLLARRLKGKFHPLWLNNAGIDGHSTFGHLVLMKDYIVQLKPKVVLFFVGVNDRALPDYGPLDKKTLKKPAANFRLALLDNLARYSEVVNYAVNLNRHSKARRLGLVHANVDFARLKTLEVPGESLNSMLNYHRAQYLIPYARRLQELIDMSREHAIEPVFMTQPIIYGEVIDPVSGADLGKVDIGGVNGKVSWEIMKLYNEVLKQVAAKNQVPLIDLAAEMPKNSRYFYDTAHFTNEGCQIVAQIIEPHLASFLAKKFPQFVTQDHPAQTSGIGRPAGGDTLKAQGSEGHPLPAGSTGEGES
jgi:lysophospholipase L1-like esterase